ncbi:MAG: hypothetical protein ABIF22_00340 [bacterium]
MKFIDKARKWPVEKKRMFSIVLAIFFTFLIIIFNSGINLIWKDETQNITFSKNGPINSIQKSFSEILNKAKPMLEQVFSSSTEASSIMSGQTEGTGEIIDQTNSTSSSFSTTSNVVE